MKKTCIFIFVVCSILAGSVALLPADENMPPAEGEALWKYIMETNPYTEWKMWPGKEGIYPGKSPHGAFLKLYVNDKAYQAVQQNQPMPNGAIIVKENYGKDEKTLMALTPMYKVEGFNPEAGDWFWAKYGVGQMPKAEVQASGKVQGCIDCHKVQKDFLFTGK